MRRPKCEFLHELLSCSCRRELGFLAHLFPSAFSGDQPLADHKFPFPEQWRCLICSLCSRHCCHLLLAVSPCRLWKAQLACALPAYAPSGVGAASHGTHVSLPRLQLPSLAAVAVISLGGALSPHLMPSWQVDEASPLRGPRPVWGPDEVQHAAEEVRAHGAALEPEPSHLQVPGDQHAAAFSG